MVEIMHLFSKDMVVFNCQLCSNPALPAFRECVDHMIDQHLGVELLFLGDWTEAADLSFSKCHGKITSFLK